MKKIVFYLFAILSMAAVFTSCSKEETEDPEAKLTDFYGNYDVTITCNGLGIGTESESYSASLKIDGVDAKLLDVTLFESKLIAKLSFTTEDEDLKSQEFYPVLDSIFGTAKGGYMNLLCTNALNGKTILFKGNTVAYKSNTITWDGYFGEKTDNWLTSITSYRKLAFKAVRKDK